MKLSFVPVLILAAATLATGCKSRNNNESAVKNEYSVSSSEADKKNFKQQVDAAIAVLQSKKASSPIEAEIVEELLALDGFRALGQSYADYINAEFAKPHFEDLYAPVGIKEALKIGAEYAGLTAGAAVGLYISGEYVSPVLGYSSGGLLGAEGMSIALWALPVVVVNGPMVAYAYINIKEAYKFNDTTEQLNKLLDAENAHMLKVRNKLASIKGTPQLEKISKIYDEVLDAAGFSKTSSRSLPSNIELKKAMMK